jgi:hypothetical protein
MSGQSDGEFLIKRETSDHINLLFRRYAEIFVGPIHLSVVSATVVCWRIGGGTH